MIDREFSVLMAKRAGLWGKQGPWTQYTRENVADESGGNCLRDALGCY